MQPKNWGRNMADEAPSQKTELLENDALKAKELLLKERELALKELETKTNLEIERQKAWLTSPLLIAVATTIFGTALVAALQAFTSLQLERQKFEFSSQLERQKFELSLIQKSLETEQKLIFTDIDRLEAARRLLFLAKSGVIKSLDSNAIEQLATKPNNLPTFPTETKNLPPVKYLFSCNIIDGIPTTVAGTSSKRRGIIQWHGTSGSNAKSPKERCITASKKFQEASDANLLKYLTTGQLNGKPAICAVRLPGTSCDFELFTVDSSVDRNFLLKVFMELNSGMSSTPIVLK
jgi:Circadian oscillating protein COP23